MPPPSFLFGLIAMLTWGTGDFFAKKAVDKIGTYATLWWNYVFSIVGYLALFFMFAPPVMWSQQLFFLLAIGAIVTFFGYITFYKGLEKGFVSVMSPIAACNLLIVAGLSVVFLNEQLTITNWLGILLALAGLVTISWPKKWAFASFEKSIPFALGTMVFWGLSIFIMGFIAKQMGWLATAIFFRLSTFVVCLALPVKNKKVLQFPKTVWVSVVLIALFEMAGAMSLNKGSETGLLSIAGTTASLFPAVTLVLAHIFLRERLTKKQYGGVAIILAGLIVASL